jgi:hypothetical protein
MDVPLCSLFVRLHPLACLQVDFVFFTFPSGDDYDDHFLITNFITEPISNGTEFGFVAILQSAEA